MVDNRVIEMPYHVEMVGDLSIDFDGEVKLLFLSITGSQPQLTGQYMLSVGPELHVPAGESGFFRVAFDLLEFKGNGSYSIPPGSPRDLAAAGSAEAVAERNLSNVLVQYWPTDIESQPEVFDRVGSACRLVVSKDGLKGELSCSEVSDDKGRKSSVLMRWG